MFDERADSPKILDETINFFCGQSLKDKRGERLIMKIKRTVKDGFAETGQTEIIDEVRMKKICLQCASLTYHMGQQLSPNSEADNLIEGLEKGHEPLANRS